MSLALTTATVLAVSLPAAAPAMAAGTGTVALAPSTVPAAGPGATFQVTVRSNASVDANGIQATVQFNKSLLQITSVARTAGSAWGNAATFIGPRGDLTVAANLANQIADANGTGSLSTIAAQVTPGSGTPAASGVDQPFLTLTFLVVTCPASGSTTPITLPSGPSNTVLNDANGDPVAITLAGATVTPCSANTGLDTTRVTSTMGAGFLEILVPDATTIQLSRSVTNSVDIPVKVFSDGTWTLNVADSMPAGKLAADRGRMVDTVPTTKRLTLPIQAQVDAGPIRTLDQPQASTNVMSGQSSQEPLVTLYQAVGPTDAGGSYSIGIQFTATSGF